MLSLLGWIPVIGPIVEGITSMFNKFQDKEIVRIKTQGTTDVANIQSSAQTLRDFRDEIGVRLARDIIMFPGSIWCGLYIWDKIVDHRFPSLVWNVASLDGPLVALPYALLTFFFGYTAITSWRR